MSDGSGASGWRRWTQVEHFDESSPTDEHFVLDAAAGEVVFGPGVRHVDGTVRQFGAVPRKAAPIRAAVYRVGGGRRGNVARGAIRALRTSVPFVTRVHNRRPATGGVDGEDIAAAIARAPAFLRTRQRAVTVADYEYLAQAADPRVGRVRCVSGSGPEAAVIRLAVLPVLSGDPAQPGELRDWAPPPDLLARVASDLDSRRVLGTRLIVESPFFQPVTAVARLVVRPGADPERVMQTAVEAMYRYLHPAAGGPDGTGWPFGRSVVSGELLAEVARLPGVELVAEVRLYRSQREGDEGWSNRVELGQGALPLSQGHRVELVERAAR